MECRLSPYPIKLFDLTVEDTSFRVNNGEDFHLPMSFSEQAVQTEPWEGHRGSNEEGVHS